MEQQDSFDAAVSHRIALRRPPLKRTWRTKRVALGIVLAVGVAVLVGVGIGAPSALPYVLSTL